VRPHLGASERRCLSRQLGACPMMQHVVEVRLPQQAPGGLLVWRFAVGTGPGAAVASPDLAPSQRPCDRRRLETCTIELEIATWLKYCVKKNLTT
jgi:hypothetical protein